jgi:hypothetical protein
VPSVEENLVPKIERRPTTATTAEQICVTETREVSTMSPGKCPSSQSRPFFQPLIVVCVVVGGGHPAACAAAEESLLAWDTSELA